ncbi:hypothetical protein [Geothrix terrae]|uniref:hypothetical protein n=1 Tax=Geothrix terrae TaxID=2922720 RepID=UPI001FAC9C87|nr:hypothetical protein [Geothrix terrae]
MSAFRWIPRKKTRPFTIHADVLKVLQTKAALPSMPRMDEKIARHIKSDTTPNEACYVFGAAVARGRVKANPQAVDIQDPESSAFRIVELACSLGAYRLALRGELLTDESVYAEARKVMPEIQAKVGGAS